MVRSQGAQPVAPVASLPETIPQSSLPDSVDGLPVLGVASDTLEPVGFEPEGVVMIAGLPRSGRSNAVLALVNSLSRHNPDRPVYCVARARSPPTRLGFWRGVAVDTDSLKTMLSALQELLARPAEAGGELIFKTPFPRGSRSAYPPVRPETLSVAGLHVIGGQSETFA
jgi:S-DNA-T family DNA segregation ATPase FtsK/SpoIIIE